MDRGKKGEEEKGRNWGRAGVGGGRAGLPEAGAEGRQCLPGLGACVESRCKLAHFGHVGRVKCFTGKNKKW